MDQCPKVGSPTSEIQPSWLAGAPRAFHPHSSLSVALLKLKADKVDGEAAEQRTSH